LSISIRDSVAESVYLFQ